MFSADRKVSLHQRLYRQTMTIKPASPVGAESAGKLSAKYQSFRRDDRNPENRRWLIFGLSTVGQLRPRRFRACRCLDWRPVSRLTVLKPGSLPQLSSSAPQNHAFVRLLLIVKLVSVRGERLGSNGKRIRHLAISLGDQAQLSVKNGD